MNSFREITILCNHSLSPRLHYSLFRISPFSKGQGLTVASTLRQLLLNEIGSIQITSINIRKPIDIFHEFSIISGFQESLPEIIGNLQDIVLRQEINSLAIDNSSTIANETIGLQKKNQHPGKKEKIPLSFRNYASIKTNGKKIITANEIQFSSLNKTKNIQVVDPTQIIATAVSPYACFDIHLELIHSKHYVACTDQSFPIEKNAKTIIPLNPSFNPVKRVNYFIKENENLNYEFLLFEIWTDGSISPSEALGHSSIALKQVFQPFI
jgi:DNA-directed RNA polymerase subunit alpha